MKKYRNIDISYHKLFSKVKDLVVDGWRIIVENSDHEEENLDNVMAWLGVGDKKEGKGLKEMSPERFFTLREPKLLGDAHQTPVMHISGGRGHGVFLGDAR
jgi:hypothetical protein